MKHPAYHLRPNKIVDRLLFLRSAEDWAAARDLSQHTYFGLGGPFLDDIRAFAQSFPHMKFVAIERNEATHKRQRFHQPIKNMRFVCSDMASFLNQGFIDDRPSIIWLDYTDLKVERFAEFQSTLQRVGNASIVKVTMRAQTDITSIRAAAEHMEGDAARRLLDEWLDDFSRKFGSYLPTRSIDAEDVSTPNFVSLLSEMIKLAAEDAFPVESPQSFQIVHSCQYTDGTTMLSVTGIVGDSAVRKRAREVFRSWDLRDLDWSHDPHRIDVPDLSVKERLLLEKHLPTKSGTGKGLQRVLGYKIDNSDAASCRRLKQYERFHSEAPLFTKTSV